MREHDSSHMNILSMQPHFMEHSHFMFHGLGILALVLSAVLWGALLLVGWRFFRNGTGWQKLMGLLLIGLGLLPLSGLILPVLLISLFVKIWKLSKKVSSERDWTVSISEVSAASADSRYDPLDEWERNVRLNQKQQKLSLD